MEPRLLSDLTDQNRADFGHKTVQLQHRLHQHPLFSDEALCHLLESVKREDYLVNTMDVNSHDRSTRREGELGNLPGSQILEAVGKGHIWVLLLRLQRLDQRYQQLLEQLYGEFSEQVPGFRPHTLNMAMLISSPNVHVYYHCDVPGQMLWQIRGHKSVFVYPNRPPYLAQPSIERITMGEHNEFALPYDESFERGVTRLELHPGQMLHWPLNCPHRIVNGNCVNVSFATEHFTPALRRQYIVNYANGVLRNRFGYTNLSQRTTGIGYWTKLGVVGAYKATGHQTKRWSVSKAEFRVDPTAPNGVRPIAGYSFRPGHALEPDMSVIK